MKLIKMITILSLLLTTANAGIQELKIDWETTNPIRNSAYFAIIAKPIYARIETETITEISIPAAIIIIANNYKNTLQKYFGEGAETNEIISHQYVSLYLQTLTTEDTAALIYDSYLIDNAFRTLTTFTSKDETWSFPFGSTIYTNISINVTQNKTSIMKQNGVHWNNVNEMLKAFSN